MRGVTPSLITLALVSGGPALAQERADPPTRTGANILQRPLQVDLGVVPRTAPSASDLFQESLRLRNAIVTGNAANGLSFRGDTPFAAASDFRGELGSNDLFAFRRDTLSSGLGGLGIRGSDALQAQFSLIVGSRPPAGLIGSGIVNRAGSGAIDTSAPIGLVDPRVGRDAASLGVNFLDPGASDQDLSDPMGGLGGSLRSTSLYVTSAGDRASILAAFDTEDGSRVGLTASPNDGVRYVPLDDRARGSEPIEASAPGAFIPGAQSVTIETTTTLDALTAQIASVPLLPGETDIWPSLLADMRSKLLVERAADAPDEDDPSVDPAFVSRIREVETTVESLLPGDDLQAALDPFMSDLAAGESLLREGRYFDAEERFARALSSRPEDTAAQFGRIQAQLGAGLLGSASVNLRLLIAEHPEVLVLTLDEGMLPGTSRVDEIVRAIDAGTEGSTRFALLRAYLGRQLGVDSLRDEGIDALMNSASSTDRALGELLSGVWDAEEETESAPDDAFDESELETDEDNGGDAPPR